MHKKDLIIRQFEEFGKVLAVILTHKRNMDWESFEREINQAFQKFSGLEMTTIENLDAETFGKEVVGNKTLSREQKKIIGSLLFEKMHQYGQTSDGKYQTLQQNCLALYTALANDLTENEFDLDIHYKLEALKSA